MHHVVAPLALEDVAVGLCFIVVCFLCLYLCYVRVRCFLVLFGDFAVGLRAPSVTTPNFQTKILLNPGKSQRGSQTQSVVIPSATLTLD